MKVIAIIKIEAIIILDLNTFFSRLVFAIFFHISFLLNCLSFASKKRIIGHIIALENGEIIINQLKIKTLN